MDSNGINQKGTAPIEQFDVMGSQYIESLVHFPSARDEELALVERYLAEANTILDYACGDGFLTKFILQVRPQATIYGVDSSMTMLQALRKKYETDARVTGFSTDEFDRFEQKLFDVSVSLGGLHHVLDQVGCLSRIHRKINVGGLIVFADFEDQSPSQRYFDGLINDYNPTGHVGLFISQSRAENLARACRLRLDNYSRQTVDWTFSSRDDLLRFVCQHHGLRCSPETVLAFLERDGMIVPNGRSWSLRHHYATLTFRA